MLRLKRLSAKACRGIVDGPDLHFEPAGLLLCGDNGTGKSSFIDAIERVLTGKCSALDTGEQGISWKRNGTHVGSKGPAEIELVLAEGNKDFTLSPDLDPSTIDSGVRVFLEAASQQSFILRRRTLLKYIDVRPQERYTAVEGFLNLDRFAALESQLKELLNTAQAKLRALETAGRDRERTLRQQLKVTADAPISEASCFSRVNCVLTEAGLGPVVTMTEVQVRLSESEALLAPFSDVDAIHRVHALLQLVKDLPDVSTVLAAGRDYSDARQEFSDEEVKQRGHFYAELLAKGLEWIKQDSLDQCPLCNQQIELESVTDYISARLAENSKFTQLRESQSVAHKAFTDAATSHLDVLKKIKEQWKPALGQHLPANAEDLYLLLTAMVQANANLLPVESIVKDTDNLAKADANSVASSLASEVQTSKTRLPDAERYETLYSARASLLIVSVQLPEMDAETKEMERLAECISQIKRIAALAEQGRKTAVQKLMDKTAEIADGYFRKIHPNESIGGPALKVTDRGTASLSLTSSFHGKEGDPRGHYSEGHVDSLGLCLFLAIRRLHHRQRPELSLLILDDVLHSVDGAHRRSTANLIFEEFKDHQIIITTHDPLWFENLKEACRKHFPKHRFSQHRIAGWSYETGPVWGDHLSDYEWLTSPVGMKARPADRVIKAGRLLEEMLKNLCDGLGVAVPFRIQGDYSIGPLWESFYKTAKKNKPVFDAAGTSLETIEGLRSYRNWVGAHWNEWAGLLTDSESRNFSDAVIELRDSVYCPNCRQFVRRIAQLKGVSSCGCEQKRFKKGNGSSQLSWNELLGQSES